MKIINIHTSINPIIGTTKHIIIHAIKEMKAFLNNHDNQAISDNS